MEFLAVLIMAFGIFVVGDTQMNDGVNVTAASNFLAKEVGDDLLGIEDPNQKYAFGNATVDKFGNLKAE